jgi:hypothetical protein
VITTTEKEDESVSTQVELTIRILKGYLRPIYWILKDSFMGVKEAQVCDNYCRKRRRVSVDRGGTYLKDT